MKNLENTSWIKMPNLNKAINTPDESIIKKDVIWNNEKIWDILMINTINNLKKLFFTENGKVYFTHDNEFHELVQWNLLEEWENEMFYRFRVESNWSFIHNFILEFPKDFVSIEKGVSAYSYGNNWEIFIDKIIPNDKMINSLFNRSDYNENLNNIWFDNNKEKIDNIIAKIKNFWIDKILSGEFWIKDVLWNFNTYSMESSIFYSIGNARWLFYWWHENRSDRYISYVREKLDV